MTREPGSETLSAADLEALVVRALVASRTAPGNARSVARALTQAEIDGQKGHGLSRVPSYAAQAKAGKVDGFATPTASQLRPGTLMIDVRHGFVFPAVDLAVDMLPDLARQAGLAAAGFVRSHHFGVVGRHVERLAEAGLVALAFANTPKAIAAWGGRRQLYGTNPIAFACPHQGQAPIVVDLALSQVARGTILTAAQRGEPVPTSWATDADGKPTSDAKAALKGALQPIGAAKGAALALMVEILAAGLTGATLSQGASSFFDTEGPPPAVGQLVIGIDPQALGGAEALAQRVGALAAAIEADGPARLPGSRRLGLRERAARQGMVLDARLLAEVRAIAEAGS
jgi:(2R)-3-sulfolactate dehydrogenase (NADP+)